MLWVFWLTLGLFFYRRNQPLWAGVAFALATTDRLFPGAFAAAAVVVSAAAAWRTSRSVRILEPGPWRFVVLLVAGGVLAVVVGVAVPELIWPGAWRSFAANISEHTHYLFSNHFGLVQGRRVLSRAGRCRVFESDAAHLHRLERGDAAADALAVLRGVRVRGLGPDLDFQPLRLPAEAAVCFMGLSFPFFLTPLPAHYYLDDAAADGRGVPRARSCRCRWSVRSGCCGRRAASRRFCQGEPRLATFASVLMMAMFTFSAVLLAVSTTRSPLFRARVGAAATIGLLAVHAGIVWPAGRRGAAGLVSGGDGGAALVPRDCPAHHAHVSGCLCAHHHGHRRRDCVRRLCSVREPDSAR